MFKRTLAGVLWFLATTATYGMAALLLGLPSGLGPIVALPVAALVVLDPAGLIWASTSRSGQSMTTDVARALTAEPKLAD